jgi:Flp pilus assembly protein TadD
MERSTDAISDFTTALTIDSRIAHAYANRGMALYTKGKTAEAQADFDRAYEIKPALREVIANNLRILKSKL